MRRFRCFRIGLVGKLFLLSYLVLIVYMLRKLNGGVFKRTSPSTRDSLDQYIPRCYHNITELVNSIGDKRWRMEITFAESKAIVTNRQVGILVGPQMMRWDHDLPCLKLFVKQHCYRAEGQAIPEIFHFIWFGEKSIFKAEHLISFLSTVRYQQPCAILVHSKELPTGPYWTLVLSITPNIIHVFREEPQFIFGWQLEILQHRADVVRLEVLYDLGGIYMDADQHLVRNVTELLNETVVMSHENANNLANSMILARPNSEFIDRWYGQYQWYNRQKWGYHSTYVPWKLAKQHSSLIKVVGNRFVNPDLANITKVFKSHYDISNNYGLHLYTRLLPSVQLTLPEVTTWNSTLGDLWRFILYGSTKLKDCVPKKCYDNFKHLSSRSEYAPMK